MTGLVRRLCIPMQNKIQNLQSAAVVWGDRLASLIINTCMVLECTMICVLYIVVVGDLFTKAIENTEGTGQNYLSNIFLLNKTARKNIWPNERWNICFTYICLCDGNYYSDSLCLPPWSKGEVIEVDSDVGDIFILVTDLRCWWQSHYVGHFFRYVGDFLNVLNRSPTSWIGHQHFKLVTNIDVTQHITYNTKRINCPYCSSVYHIHE